MRSPREVGAQLRIVLVAWFVASCAPDRRQTSLFIRVDFDSGLSLDQLLFEGVAPGGEVAFGPATRPQQAAGLLSSGQSLRVQLDDGWADTNLTLDVVGVLRGSLAGAGAQVVTTQSGRETDGFVALLAASVGGDGGLSRCPPGFCPSGCCSGTACNTGTDIEACGSSGAACFSCDALRNDRCVEGQCRCGDGASCNGGQHCVDGECRCDATSCLDGCCAGSVCVKSVDRTACGIGGAQCIRCGADADACSAGACTCGQGLAACRTGLRCVSGTCTCDSTSCSGCCASDGSCAAGNDAAACGIGGNDCSSCPPGDSCQGGVCSGCSAASCPAGCCSGSSCVASSRAACGVSGSACLTCDLTSADRCAGGRCQCGWTEPCQPGQRCRAATCVCDSVSCPAGCCSGTACVTSTSLVQCGTQGATCDRCDAALADGCTLGGCSCGRGPACNPGEACIQGTCQCSASTCPGCCSSSGCVLSPSFPECGGTGGSCVACDSMRADSCNAGVCACGAGPACAQGQRCLDGSCVCDITSCPNSCCYGVTCVTPPTTSLCGNRGSQCSSCDVVAADNCSGGACACGAGPACSTGRCVEGTCL